VNFEEHEHMCTTRVADECTAHETDPWRANNEWLDRWLRHNLRSYDLFLQGLVCVG